jgi:hypothetical protein
LGAKKKKLFVISTCARLQPQVLGRVEFWLKPTFDFPIRPINGTAMNEKLLKTPCISHCR